MSNLKNLCLEYTKLDKEDIEILLQLEAFLPLISKVSDGDTFIDCITKDCKVAIVVAESLKEHSSYKDSVIGKLAYSSKEPAALRTLNTGVTTNQLHGISQENFPIEQTTVAIRNKKKIIGVLILEKVSFEDIPVVKEKNFDNLPRVEMSSMPDIYLVFDKNAKLIDYNLGAKIFYEKMGYSNIYELTFNNLVLEEITFDEISSKKYIRTKDLLVGDQFVDIQYSSLSSDGRISVFINDTTEIKNQKQELVNKSIALHEVHHRVKNNLQIVASLLRLQLRRSEDEKIRNIFQESINRIMSMAVIHEILSRDVAGVVEIKQMTEQIISTITQGKIWDKKRIETKVLGDEISLDAQTAVFLALVLNELISNSYFHAFSGLEIGSITIRIQKSKGYNTIIVVDDGVGFDKENIRKDSLGLSIVEGLVKESLDGAIYTDSSDLGTKTIIRF